MIEQYKDLIIKHGTDIGLKILAALVFWVVGRWLIRMVVRMVQSSLVHQKLEPTVLRYLGSVINVVLNIVLVIGILGYFGIQTTTFAALLAAAGVAIGMAWSGLLGNFAAGAFLIVLRPFKVGDFVTVAGISGTVREIGLFTTSLDTPDNVFTIVGNGKIFGDTIQNFSTNPYRRLDLKVQLSGKADALEAMKLLKAQLATVPNVLPKPAVDVEILEFTLVGPVLIVRPYCHTSNYWQVYFDSYKMIRQTLAEAHFPAPMPAQTVVVQQS